MKISKELKEKSKISFDGPKSKQRKKIAPPTKILKPKKGKGASVKKETFDEDEESFLSEEISIINFLESIVQKKYSDAYKYLNQAVGAKFQKRIEAEVATPLF